MFTYTGNATISTVGTGLSSELDFLIIKNSTSINSSAIVWHRDQDGNYNDFDNAAPSAWLSTTNFTNSSAGLFTVNTGSGVNGSGLLYTAYAFHEVPGYSRFGNYTGTGAVSGENPYIHLGFMPEFLLIKGNNTGVWVLYDGKRGYNLDGSLLTPDNTGIENSTSVDILFTIDGFQVQTTNGSINSSGINYVYAAFAKTPLTYANPRVIA